MKKGSPDLKSLAEIAPSQWEGAPYNLFIRESVILRYAGGSESGSVCPRLLRQIQEYSGSYMRSYQIALLAYERMAQDSAERLQLINPYLLYTSGSSALDAMMATLDLIVTGVIKVGIKIPGFGSELRSIPPALKKLIAELKQQDWVKELILKRHMILHRGYWPGFGDRLVKGVNPGGLLSIADVGEDSKPYEPLYLQMVAEGLFCKLPNWEESLVEVLESSHQFVPVLTKAWHKFKPDWQNFGATAISFRSTRK